MNEIDEYFDGIIARINATADRSGFDKRNQLIDVFEEERNIIKTQYSGKKIDIRKIKRLIKDALFEGIGIRNIEDEYDRIRTAISMYALLDYKWEHPNSPLAIREICKDLGVSLPNYIKLAFKLAANITESGPKGKN